MNQPELGKKIYELRNQKGITQKDLSESCNIDIRTIQRIEAGDVIPRASTLKLIAKTLDSDITILKENTQNHSVLFIRKMLLASFIAGIFNFINWFFYTGLSTQLYKLSYDFKLIFIISSVIYVFTIAILYYGLFYLGKFYKNKLLQTTAIAFIIITYFYVVTDLSKDSAFSSGFILLNKLVLYISNINGIVFAISLIITKSRYIILYKITGILLIILASLFFFSITPVILVACWLGALYYLFLPIIVFFEYRNSNLVNYK